MKMKNLAAMAATTAVCAALSAGAAAADQDRIPELKRESAPVAPTLSGCVARGTAAGTYTLTSGARKGGFSFKDREQPRTVVLTALDVDLATHVGHAVSVTGSYTTALEAFGIPVGTSGMVKPAPEVPAGTVVKELRTFAVTSLKMVAPSCSEAAD
jgi:hypothetical protein